MDEIGIWPHLWLQQVGSGSFIKPTTPYVMYDDKKNVFLQIIKKLRTPTNYVATLQSRIHKYGKL
jgi:hypothetical protein